MIFQDVAYIATGSFDDLCLSLKHIRERGNDSVGLAMQAVHTFLKCDRAVDSLVAAFSSLPEAEQRTLSLSDDVGGYDPSVLYDPVKHPEILWALNVVLFEMSDGKRFDYPTISALGEAENVKRVCKRFPEMSAARIDAALNLVSATLAMELGEDMGEYKFEAVEVKFH